MVDQRSTTGELVRDSTASFYSRLDDIVPLDPAKATVVPDHSPRYRTARRRADGRSRGNHAFLSAVAVLRVGPAAHRLIATWLAEHVHEFDTDVAAFDAAFTHAEDHLGDHNGDRGEGEPLLHLDMSDTVSTQAQPVPRTVFDGPGDRRWCVIEPGRYGPLGTATVPS